MGTLIVHPTSEQEEVVKKFLESQNVYFDTEDGPEELPQHVLDGIQRGLDDVAAGRTISFDEFKVRHLSTK